MKLTILGSGTAVPTPARKSTGFLIERGRYSVLIDGGSGSVHALVQAGVQPMDLDAGLYTHRHPDHTGDLVSLLFAMRAGKRAASAGDYPIFAGAGFAGFLEKLHACYPGWLSGRDWKPRVQELPLEAPGYATLPGGLDLMSMPANHSAGALHFRLTSPEATIVFSGDTGPSDALTELSRGADLLVCECALAEQRAGVAHLWPAAVREIVAAAIPRRVLLSHLYEEVNEALALAEVGRAGVPVERAFDGQVIQF